jgi:hypothetical protein
MSRVTQSSFKGFPSLLVVTGLLESVLSRPVYSETRFAPPSSPIAPVECTFAITADGQKTEWPDAITPALKVISSSTSPAITTGLLCIRHTKPGDPSGTQDTLYMYLIVADATVDASDSVFVVFDINRDQVLGSEDRGIWLSRLGQGGQVDGQRLVPSGMLPGAVLAHTTNALCPPATICMEDIPSAWRIEAKLLPSYFGLTNFSETVGAYVEAFDGATGNLSLWPSVILNDPTGWQNLRLGTPNYRFCFRDVINTPDTYKKPPHTDGTIAGDNGWTSAWRYVFNDGTTPDVVVQGIKDADSVYLSFEINHDQDFTSGDLITIAFDPSSAPNDEWHLGIRPFQDDGTIAIAKQHWTGTYVAGAADPATNVDVAVTPQTNMSDKSWFVEVAIPRTALGLPASGDFGFYFNVFPSTAPTSGPFGMTREFPWPTERSAVMGGNENVQPDTANWGRGTIAATSCNGVWIDPSDIKTMSTRSPTWIANDQPNVFVATAHNSSINGSGVFIPATNIKATFKIANFGLPNQWAIVRADLGTSNPTAEQTIPANSGSDFTFKWQFTGTEPSQYAFPYDHQCILVELDASGAAATMTTFANKSAWTNMDIGTASRFISAPVVDGRGYGPPPRGQIAHLFQLMTDRAETTFTVPSDTSAARKLEWKPYSEFRYTVRGCLFSGGQIKIGGQEYRICEPVGSFGYVIRHLTTTRPVWRVAVSGRGLSRRGAVSHNAMLLSVPPETEVTLNVVIKAGHGGLLGVIESIPWWLWGILGLVMLLVIVFWLRRE